MLIETFALPLLLGISMALLACRLIEWIPHDIDRQESEWIAQILNEHLTPEALKAMAPPSPATLSNAFRFWQWPSLSATNALCTVCTLSVLTLAFATQPSNWQSFFWSIWGGGLVVLAFVDARTKLLPDALTLPLLWLGIVIQLFPETRTVGLEMSIIGAVAGYLPLWLLAQAYRLIRGRDGLGMGDLKLLAAMGVWSGPFLLPQVLLLAALLAIAVFVMERVLRRSANSFHDERPFGPSIVAAYFIVLLFTHSLGTI